MSPEASDLSPADIAALKRLRQVQLILVDEAGQHAPSLQRLVGAGVLTFTPVSTRHTADKVSPTQIELGYRANGGTGAKGERYCTAPAWLWPGMYAGVSGEAAQLLREIEGRWPVEIDVQDAYTFVSRSYSQRKAYPTVAMVAKRFGHSVEDTIDWIDRQPYVLRGGSCPIDSQTVELDGE